MGFFKKTDYEKHANNLHKKLTKIIKTMDSRELKEVCQKVIGKYPKQGTRIFDSEYNLIQKFGYRINHDDYMLYFTHNRKQGKFSDLKLTKFLVMRDILDFNDPDFNYLKQFAKSEDELDYTIPRNHFPQKIKDAIRKIQRNRCAVYGCKNTDFFEFDHIKGREDNSLSNCQMLCMHHHRIKTNQDAIKTRIEKNLNDGKSINDVRLGPNRNYNPKKRHHTPSRRKPKSRQLSHKVNSSRKSKPRRPRR